MGSLLHFSARHPLLSFPFLLLLTVLAASQLPRLQVRIAETGILETNAAAQQLQQSTEAKFGQDDVGILYLADPALFTSDKLKAIRAVIGHIQALPFVEQTDSLFSAPHAQDRRDAPASGPYLDTHPDDPARLEDIRRQAMANPLLKGKLIGRSGDALAVDLYFKEPDSVGATELAAINRLLLPLRGELEQVFFIGEAKVRQRLAERLQHDLEYLLPLALLVLFVAPAALLQRPNAALAPLVTTTISVILTLGTMAWLAIPLNLLTSMVPALIAVFSTANTVHLLDTYITGIRRDLTPKGALGFMIRHKGLPVFLALLAGGAGFAAAALGGIQALPSFGLLTAAGLLFSFIATAIAVPALMSVMGENRVDDGVRFNDKQLLLRRWSMQLLRLAVTYRKISWFLLALLAASALVGISRLQLDHEPSIHLDPASTIRAEIGLVQRELSGFQGFSIVLDSGIEDTFVQVRYLNELRKIQDRLAAMGGFGQSYSLADLVTQAHREMAPPGTAVDGLPDLDDTVRDYLRHAPQRALTPYVSEDFRQARILVRHGIESAHRLNQTLEGVQAFIDAEVDPEFRVWITGRSVLAGQALGDMPRNALQSLALFGTALWLAVSLMFLNARAGITALLPIGLPLLVLLGVMGHADISLDAVTLPLSPIALGIGVAATLHLMSRYHRNLRRYHNGSRALSRTIAEEALPVIVAALSPAAAFAVLATSDFAPVAHFGLLGALLSVASLLSALFLLPLLLGSAELLTLWEMLSLRLAKEALQRSPLFRGLGNWQIKKVILTGEVRKIARETTLAADDLDRGQVFILLRGRAEYRGQGPDEVLNTWQAGDTLSGHMIQAQPDPEGRAVALEDLQLLVVGWQRVDRIAKAFPSLALTLYRNLGQILGPRLEKVERVPDHFYLGDPTGLYGREFLAGRMEQEIRRSVRQRTPLSFVSLQIGVGRAGIVQPLTEAPDALFQQVIEVIEGLIREVDMVARWNQGNPALLLPNTGIEQARETARRVTRALQERFAEQGLQLEISSRCRRLDEDQAPAESPRMLPTATG